MAGARARLTPVDPDIAGILTELGIPADYGLSRNLPRQPEAAALVQAAIAPDDGKPVLLTAETAAAWQAMERAAAADGVTLWPLSGFRSIGRQTELIRHKLAAGERITDILHMVAAPGYSEHHSGRALDIGSPDQPTLSENFAATAAYRWLVARARGFGFHLSYPQGNPYGITSEPWHWCWRPST